MAIAQVHNTSTGSATFASPTTLTIPTPTAGNQMVVCAVVSGTAVASPWGITPQGTQAFTNIVQANQSTANVAIWVTTNIGTSTSVIVTPPVSGLPSTVTAVEFSGITSTIDATYIVAHSGFAVASLISGTYTPTVDDLLVTFVETMSNTTSTLGTSSSGWSAGTNIAMGTRTSALWWKESSAAESFVATASPNASMDIYVVGIAASVISSTAHSRTALGVGI